MEKFDIILDIQEPTAKQLTVEKFRIRHRMICQEADHFRKALLRILNDKLDFSLIDYKESLTIRYKRTGNFKIDYSTIQNTSVKFQIRRVIENSSPLVF